MLSDFLLLLVIITAIKGELARGFTGRPSLVANLVSISAVFFAKMGFFMVGLARVSVYRMDIRNDCIFVVYA